MLRADAAADFGPELSERVSWIWNEAWKATGIGVWVTVLHRHRDARDDVCDVEEAADAAAGRAVRLRAGRRGRLSRGDAARAELDAVDQRVAVRTERTLRPARRDGAGGDQSGCTKRRRSWCRAIAFGEPSLVFNLGNKIVLPPCPTRSSAGRAGQPPGLADQCRGRRRAARRWTSWCRRRPCRRPLHPVRPRRYATNYSNGDPSILVAAVLEPAGLPSAGGAA